VATAQSLLTNLAAHQQRVGRLIQRGDTAAALPGLGDIVAGWQTLQRLAAALPQTATAPHTAALTSHLTTLATALKTGDWCALSDTLIYDLDADAKHWGELLAGG
jgi:hypothetical protein